MKNLAEFLNLTSENPKEDKKYQFSTVLKQTLDKLQNSHVEDFANLIDLTAKIYEIEIEEIKNIDIEQQN